MCFRVVRVIDVNVEFFIVVKVPEGFGYVVGVLVDMFLVLDYFGCF